VCASSSARREPRFPPLDWPVSGTRQSSRSSVTALPAHPGALRWRGWRRRWRWSRWGCRRWCGRSRKRFQWRGPGRCGPEQRWRGSDRNGIVNIRRHDKQFTTRLRNDRHGNRQSSFWQYRSIKQALSLIIGEPQDLDRECLGGLRVERFDGAEIVGPAAQELAGDKLLFW
jgi:hypothetical protein